MRITTYVDIYKARDGYRWRAKAGNNKIIADGGEPYTRARSCRRAVDRIVRIGSTYLVIRDTTKRK